MPTAVRAAHPGETEVVRAATVGTGRRAAGGAIVFPHVGVAISHVSVRRSPPFEEPYREKVGAVSAALQERRKQRSKRDEREWKPSNRGTGTEEEAKRQGHGALTNQGKLEGLRRGELLRDASNVAGAKGPVTEAPAQLDSSSQKTSGPSFR